MLEIQEKQLQHLVAVLNGMGCTYAIRKPDGEVIGTLEVKPVKVEKPYRTRTTRHSYKHYNLPERIRAMAVGEVIVIERAYPNDTLQGLSAWVSSVGIGAFGKGSFTVFTDVKNSAVQGMRTA